MATSITILKIEDPFHFWGKEVPGPGMSQETIKFQELSEEIQDFCSSDQYVIEHVADPVKGKMYLGQRPDDGMWYRIRVINSFQTSMGIKANCHLVDFAETFMVPINRLKEIPAKLKSFPPQAKPFRLHGIQPTTLKVNLEEDAATVCPADKWDIAAKEYFCNLVENRSAQVDVHGIGRKETRFVTLYVNTPQGQVNVNEDLVQRNYAVFADRDFDEVSEIGASEGACSRPMTPMTITPKMPAPSTTSSDTEDKIETTWLQLRGDADGSKLDRGQLQGIGSSARSKGRSSRSSSGDEMKGAAGSKVRSPGDHRDIRLLPHRPARIPEVRQGARSGSMSEDSDLQQRTNQIIVKDGQGCSRVDPHDVKNASRETDLAHRIAELGKKRQECSSASEERGNISSGTASPETVGRGRGLAALCNTSEVGRKRSQSPLTSPTSSKSPSNIVKSDTLQKSLDHRHLRGSSPKPSKTPEPHVGATPPSPKQRLLQKDDHVSPRAGETPPAVVSQPMRLPFLIDRKIPPKVLSTNQGASSESIRPNVTSPPSFVSPVSTKQASKLPWKQGVHKGLGASPSSSDWNKMSSTSGNSDMSDHDVRIPERQKKPSVPKASPTERTKIIKDRLMKQLAPRSGVPESPPTMSATSHPHHHHRPDHDIIVHGDRPPDPVKHISQAPFHEKMCQDFDKLRHISHIQSHAWPAVLRGRDMVGVAPGETGRSLAYLLPLITQILQPSTYANLPPGNGPLVLIVCPSWCQAARVFDDCQQYVKTVSKTIKTILLYGGGNEELQEVQLVNGCHVIVSTVPCLLRLVKSNHTNLNRLCHLVFDDAHITFRDFLDGVKELMSLFLTVLRVQQKRSAPRQLLVFASEWTSAIGSFLRSYMTNQLVVITHKLEAAVYARVRQSIEVLDADQREQVLLGKLQSGLAKGTKVVIFANESQTAYDLSKTLTSSSYYTLRAVDDMPSDAVQKVKKEWFTHHRPDSIPLLVMTDGAIPDIGVTDASCIIHYDFPANKTHYGKRLCCMIRHFESQIKEKKRAKCQSLAFVSQDKLHVLAHMSSLLFRSGQHGPQQFTEEQLYQAKEERRKHKPLCHELKAFGVCREDKCGSRHVLFPELDEPGSHPDYMDLPKQGTVMVLITYIVDASCYYVRLIKHRLSDDHKTVSMETDYVQLTIDLQQWYGDPAHRVCQRPLELGDICGVGDGIGCYSRVKVLSWVSKATEESPGTAEVQYVDVGGFEVVSVDKIFRLPDHLRQVKFQAVEVFVGRVRPVDNDFSWTTRGDLLINELLRTKQLEGRIVLTMGNTLWLDPLVERRHLTETKALTTVLNLREEMRRQHFAVDNPDHIKRLRKLCEGKVHLPPKAAATQVDETLKLPAPARLNESSPTQVYLSAVDTPERLYMQPVKSNYRLERLMETLNHKMAGHVITGDCQVTVGELCIAKFPLDGRWYRSRMMAEDANTDERDMFFIDYGDQEWVPKGHICPMPPECVDLAPQAIECGIGAITPSDPTGWADKAGDALWSMCNQGDGDGVKVPLTVEVTSSELCEFTGGYSYTVNMFDQTSGEKILVSKRLIDAGLAQPTQEFMKVMFTKVDVSQSDSGSMKQLSKLCAQLYQVKSNQGQLGLVSKIDELLTSESDRNTLLSSGSIRAVCQVICNGKLKDNVIEQLVRSLVRLATEESGIGIEIANEGGLRSMITVMEKTSDRELKEEITSIIKNISSEKRPRDMFLAAGGLDLLGDHLLIDYSPLMIQNICLTLQNLLYYNDLVQKEMPPDVICSLCVIMKSTTEVDKLCPVLKVLTDLATSQRNRELIVNHNGLDVACSLMWNASEDLVIRHTALLLESLGDSHALRDAMVNADLEPCLEGRMISERTSTETKEACGLVLDLLYNHDVHEAAFELGKKALPSTESTIPKTHPTGLSKNSAEVEPLDGRGDGEDDFDDMPPLEDGEIELDRAHPKVLWSQSRNSVLLSVQLRGVKDPEVKVTTSTIDFSVILRFIVYEFHIDLFSRVHSDNFVVAPAGGEVLITLYKESLGIKWARLTQTKTKVPFISVDFERWKEDEEEHGRRDKKRAPRSTGYKIPGHDSSNDDSQSEQHDDDLSDSPDDEFSKAFADYPVKSSRSGTEDVGTSN